jgi:hypothetical protein
MMAVITVIGGIEGAATRQWDLVVVFGLTLLLQLLLLARTSVGRPPVPLRNDLVAWLRERAAATGEPLERLADRCVAGYRAGLTDTGTDRDG